jgi:hypothetical protein
LALEANYLLLVGQKVFIFTLLFYAVIAREEEAAKKTPILNSG